MKRVHMAFLVGGVAVFGFQCHVYLISKQCGILCVVAGWVADGAKGGAAGAPDTQYCVASESL
jgi:hypothetical protein